MTDTIRDSDREKIRAKARTARIVLDDLETLAMTTASRHDYQLDLLVAEVAELRVERDAAVAEAWRLVGAEDLAKSLQADVAELERRTAHAAEVILQGVDDVAAVDMTVGLDDIRALLAEAGQDNPAIGALLVVDGDEVQVVDSLHAIVADVAMLTDAVRNGRVIAAEAQADRDRAIRAAADNAAAEADHAAELAQDLQAAVDDLAAAIAPLNRPSAKLAKSSNPIGALRIVTEVVANIAAHVLDGAAGEGPKALAIALADADRIEDEIHAIEAVCEAAGMAATVERADIPAWLAEHLTTRVDQVKAKKKTKAAEVELDEAGDGDGSPWVIQRNDANGRRWWTSGGWVKPLPAAHQFSVRAEAQLHKPRGSKIVSIAEAQALADNDRRVAVAALDDAADGGGVVPENYVDGGIVDDAAEGGDGVVGRYLPRSGGGES